jgi:hypothetical protein
MVVDNASVFGGVLNWNVGTLTLVQTTVGNNIGGGLDNTGALTVIDSTISENENTTGDGGGIYNVGSLTLTNSTVSSNAASVGSGGGIYNQGMVSLTNTTITGNAALGPGGGISIVTGSVQMMGSIVAGNVSSHWELPLKPDCFTNPGLGTFKSLGYNVIGNSSGCTFTPATGDLVNVDPVLSSLAYNGGLTQTHALLPGSPAIDAVPDGHCTDAAGVPLTTDQRGVARPQGQACDIGAFELEVIQVVTIDIKPGSDPNSINCSSENVVIAVAVLTTEDLDATTVDHTTVAFEGASETDVDKKTGEPRRHEEDVDGDGDIDLVFHFRLGDTDLTCTSTEGALTGETFDGLAIEGTDAIRMIDRGGG